MNDRVDWRIVESAPPPYAKCAISGFGDGPFVDFQVRMAAIDPNVVINVDVLKDAGRFVGMVTAEDHDAVVRALAEAHQRIEVLESEAEEAQRLVQAIDVIESADFRARKRPGPKPKERVA